MKKAIMALVTLIASVFTLASPALANEPYVAVDLATLQVKAPYAEDDVVIIREVDVETNEVTATLYDKATGVALEAYSERPEFPISSAGLPKMTTLRANSNYNTVLRKTAKIASPNGKNVSTIIWAEVNVTAGQSWGQIERVNATGQNPSSGSFTLEDRHTYSQTTRFPTNTVVIGYQGTAVISSSNSLGISFNGAKLVGFSMSGSSSSTWYARKFYSGSVSIQLM